MNKEDFVKNKNEKFRKVFHTYNKLNQTYEHQRSRYEDEKRKYEAGKTAASSVSFALALFKEAEKARNELLANEITFSHFDVRPGMPECTEGHYLIVNGKVLECLCCGASTRFYNFTQEEIDMLVEAAKVQCRFLKHATISDKALFNALRDMRNSEGHVLDDGTLGVMGLAEEEYLAQEAEIMELDIAIKKEHEKKPEISPEVLRIVEEAKRLRSQADGVRGISREPKGPIVIPNQQLLQRKK